MKWVMKRKKTRWTWYQVLRASGQLSYAGLMIAAILGRSFVVGAVLMVLALLGGAFYCGWLCPFGTIQEWVGRFGRWIFRGKRIRIPTRVEKWLLPLRYILMIVGFTGLAAIGVFSFLSQPYQNFLGIIAGNMAYITTFAWVWLGFFLLSSLLIDRPFCRYFCTEGARYGLLSMARVFSIRRDARVCIDCGICDGSCPVQVSISTRSHVRHPQCINCMECISSCPVNGALSYGSTVKWKTKTKMKINEVSNNESEENNEAI